MTQTNLFSRIIFWLAIGSAVFIGLFFRLSPFRNVEIQKPAQIRQEAEQWVARRMREQIQRGLDESHAQLPEALRRNLSEQRMLDIRRKDPVQFERAVEEAALEIARRSGQSHRYLLGADSYYYFQLSENIKMTGRVGEKFKNGQYFNPLQRAPKGEWSYATLHPYLGYYAYRALSALGFKGPFMEGLALVPLLLTMLIVLAYFLLGKALCKSLFATWMGCLTLILAPICLQRGSYGWYDTDPYNSLFPLLILATFFFGIVTRRRAVLMSISGGFLTALYSQFWVGWPFILCLILMIACISNLWERLSERKIMPGVWRYTWIYAMSSLAFIVLFLTPLGFYHSLRDGLEALPQFAGSDVRLWPNVFVAVGETKSVSLKKMIFLTGNYLTFAVALVGLLTYGAYSYRSGESLSFRHWVIWLLIMFPLTLLALATERFSLLVVIPISMFVVMGIEMIERGLLAFFSVLIKGRVPIMLRTVTIILIALMVLPVQMLFAHGVARGLRPIVNDAWFETLMHLRENTPEESIILSWWPPGHFITALARRRVVSDGATQHYPECYWISRFLMSEHEREAVGIARMLQSGGSDSVQFLRDAGLDLAQAIDLVGKVVTVDRNQARQFFLDRPTVWQNQLLDLTHGQSDVNPAYVLVYDDLMGKSLAVSVMAGWNFKNAAKFLIAMDEDVPPRPFARKDYLSQLSTLTDGFLKYRPPAGVSRIDGDQVIFQNGFSMNIVTKDAYVSMPDEAIDGEPASVFFLDQGKLIEKHFIKKPINISAVIFEEGDAYGSVLADRELIRSMMFRLFYLKGAGLKYFKPFYEMRDELTGTQLRVYQILWPSNKDQT